MGIEIEKGHFYAISHNSIKNLQYHKNLVVRRISDEVFLLWSSGTEIES